jgi:hypothetical protein
MDFFGTAPYLRPSLLAAGYADAELRILRRNGSVVTVRPGAYVASEDARLEHPGERHVLAVRAAMAGLSANAVVSHVSAAALHGLPLWGASLQRVHVTRNRRSGGRCGRYVHVHAARLDTDDVVEVQGLRVTSVARTVVDLARSVAFEAAVVTADGALRAGLHRVELERAAERSAHRSGNGSSTRVVAFADGRSESAGESRSRVVIARCGIPSPDLQVSVPLLSTGAHARSDFAWLDRGTVAEFDGMAKYGRLLRPGEDAGDAVVREKLREDAIRDTGLRVVRWNWAELDDFDAAAGRLTRAFAAA